MTSEPTSKGEPRALLSIIKLIEMPIKWGGRAAALLILLSFGLMIFAIFQRYFLNTPLKWGDEMQGYLLVAIVMCGAAEALRRGDHVAIDVVADSCGNQAKRVFALIGHLAVIIFALVFGISAVDVTHFSYDFGSYSPGYLEAPMWIPQSAMIFGSIMLGLSACAGLLETMIGHGSA